eukprot:GEMP01019999.1.p1 GENE.GEMP01019999.1~~GEMP01019999.1.p1  ORF type:complete len:683 (+),score=132.83 GEMP01019999.1:31-2079(+)
MPVIPRAAREALGTAREQFQRGNFQESLDILSELLKNLPERAISFKTQVIRNIAECNEQIAEFYCSRPHLKEAAKNFKDVLRLLPKVSPDSPHLREKTRCKLIHILLLLGKNDEADATLETACEEAGCTSECHVHGWRVSMMLAEQCEKSKLSKAQMHVIDAQRLAKSKPDYFACLREIEEFHSRHDLPGTEKIVSEAEGVVDIRRKHCGHHQRHFGALLEFGQACISCDNQEQAERVLLEATKFAQDMDSKKKAAAKVVPCVLAPLTEDALKRSGGILESESKRMAGEKTQAEKDAELAAKVSVFSFSAAARSESTKHAVDNLKGMISRDYKGAQDVFLEAIGRTDTDPLVMAQTLRLLGTERRAKMNDYKNAKLWYDAALRVLQAASYQSRHIVNAQAQVYHEVGVSLGEQNISGEKEFLTANELRRQFTEPNITFQLAYRALGFFYSKMGDTVSAEKMFLAARKVAGTCGFVACTSAFELAGFYCARLHYDKAKAPLLEAKRLALRLLEHEDAMPLQVVFARVSEMLATIYKKENKDLALLHISEGWMACKIYDEKPLHDTYKSVHPAMQLLINEARVSLAEQKTRELSETVSNLFDTVAADGAARRSPKVEATANGTQEEPESEPRCISVSREMLLNVIRPYLDDPNVVDHLMHDIDMLETDSEIRYVRNNADPIFAD